MFYINRRASLMPWHRTEYWLGYRNRCVCYVYEFESNGIFRDIFEMRSILLRWKRVSLPTQHNELITDRFISVTYTAQINYMILKASEHLEHLMQLREIMYKN